jgi:hypothetical protein
MKGGVDVASTNACDAGSSTTRALVLIAMIVNSFVSV